MTCGTSESRPVRIAHELPLCFLSAGWDVVVIVGAGGTLLDPDMESMLRRLGLKCKHLFKLLYVSVFWS